MVQKIMSVANKVINGVIQKCNNKLKVCKVESKYLIV